MANKRTNSALVKGKASAVRTNEPAARRDLDLQAQFSKAVGLHQTGELSKAKQIYEYILGVHPWHFDALHLLGLLAYQAGNHVAALALIDKAISIKQDNAIFFNHKGLVLHALEHYQKAVDSYNKALSLNPRLTPAYINCGNALDALHDYEQALANYDLAIKVDPQSMNAYLNKAVTLEKISQSDRAVSACDAVLKINPEFAQAHCARGMSLLTLEKFGDAIAAFDRALALNPLLPQALCNRGVAYQRLHQYQKGLDDFNRCIELEPANSKLYFNRGSLLFQSGDITGALASYDSAILIDPNNAEAQFNKALLCLSQKEFQLGWDLYEWRFVNPKEPQAKITTGLPIWDAQNPSHRRVVIWAEQGVGDQILFGSMLKNAKERIPFMTVMLDQRLIPLFEPSLPGVNFLPLNVPIKEDNFDAHFSLMSLGSMCRQIESDFLQTGLPYLIPDLKRAEVLRLKLARKEELLCGIFWKSGLGKMGFKKSLELADLLPVLKIPGVKFVNLQYGDTNEECRAFTKQTGVQIINCDEVDNFNDLEGHAALIQSCDFLVGCSNSTAHIAGALGKKMYLALAYGHGTLWYWANEVEGRSLWYPSIKIYRQQHRGNWAEPIEAIRAHVLKGGHLGSVS